MEILDFAEELGLQICPTLFSSCLLRILVFTYRNFTLNDNFERFYNFVKSQILLIQDHALKKLLLMKSLLQQKYIKAV